MTEPTDAEIKDLYAQETGFVLDDSPAAILDFAHAVLAKWGTPAPVGVEPVAWYECNADLDAWFLAYSHNPKAKTRPLVFGDTAPQPTQAQAGAVPLTVDEVEQLIAQWSYEMHGDRARYLVRMTELHHGIKGGQHD